MQKILFSLAIVIALFAGCSDDNSNPAGGTTSDTKPAAPAVTVQGPQTASSNQYATTAKMNATLVNSFASYGQAYAQTGGTQSGNTWTWSFTQGGFSYTMRAVKGSDGSYSWTLILNGTPPGETVAYSNWKAMEGTTSGDGKSGSWTIYHENSTTKAAEFFFSTGASGVVTAELTAYEENGTLEGKYEFTNNPDGSGEMDFYTQSVLTLKVTWNANGSGSWWTYDSTTGAQTGTGSWS